MMKGKNTYLVFPPGDRTAETIKADKAVIEASGVLAFYVAGEEKRNVCTRAFGPGYWKKFGLQ